MRSAVNNPTGVPGFSSNGDFQYLISDEQYLRLSPEQRTTWELLLTQYNRFAAEVADPSVPIYTWTPPPSGAHFVEFHKLPEASKLEIQGQIPSKAWLESLDPNELEAWVWHAHILQRDSEARREVEFNGLSYEERKVLAINLWDLNPLGWGWNKGVNRIHIEAKILDKYRRWGYPSVNGFSLCHRIQSTNQNDMRWPTSLQTVLTWTKEKKYPSVSQKLSYCTACYAAAAQLMQLIMKEY